MMENKRLFQILDEMNVADGINKTRTVAISNHLISADKVKAGTKVVMGADETSLFDLLNGKHIAILLIIDKSEYDKIALPQPAKNKEDENSN